MGTLAAAFAATPESFTGKPCGVASILAQLEGEDRDWFEQAVNDRNVTATRLAKALAAEGYHLTDQTIRRHRNGCSCGTR